MEIRGRAVADGRQRFGRMAVKAVWIYVAVCLVVGLGLVFLGAALRVF